jgi:YHS domain-containing protein
MTAKPSRLTLLAAAAAALMALAIGGCAASPASREDGRPTAECPVCRENADLACLSVKIADDTPRTEYRGKMYYFCSTECKAEFEKHPEKYAGR